ncbi:MAG: Gfo/Idh/MocA family oxidoreductase [Ruminococcaceae bacterium]|nr:Gfo/Idh/MocA family oxidoreductase [Oscillospiraceae bacterium]
MKTVRYGVIGLGNQGKKYIESYFMKDMVPDASLVAVCDTDPAAVKGVVEALGFEGAVFSDYREMIDSGMVDAVMIETPHYDHPEMTVYGLTHGVHVLCEKPLCIKEEDIDRILAAEGASDAMLGVCHQNRYNPANLFVKQYLQEHGVRAAHGTVAWHRDAA